MSAGTEQLAALEADEDRLRLALPDVVVAKRELLATDDALERIALLSEWATEYPNATAKLLSNLCEDTPAAVELAPAIIGSRALDRDELADDVLRRALPQLGGAFRDVAELRLAGHPLPAWDTIPGIQARLACLGFDVGTIDGVWDGQTRAAYTRFQQLNGFPPTGERDPLVDELLSES